MVSCRSGRSARALTNPSLEVTPSLEEDLLFHPLVIVQAQRAGTVTGLFRPTGIHIGTLVRV